MMPFGPSFCLSAPPRHPLTHKTPKHPRNPNIQKTQDKLEAHAYDIWSLDAQRGCPAYVVAKSNIFERFPNEVGGGAWVGLYVCVGVYYICMCAWICGLVCCSVYVFWGVDLWMCFGACVCVLWSASGWVCGFVGWCCGVYVHVRSVSYRRFKSNGQDSQTHPHTPLPKQPKHRPRRSAACATSP